MTPEPSIDGRPLQQELLALLPFVSYVDTPDLETPMRFVAPQVKELLGCSAGDLTSRPGLLLEHVHEEDREDVRRWMTSSFGAGRAASKRFRMTGRDGAILVVEDHATEVVDPVTGEVLVYGYLRDVTEGSRMEEEARLSGSTTRAILDSALDAIMTIDAQGVITDFSRAAEEMFGYTRDEALGALLGELVVPPAYRKAHQAAVDGLGAGAPPRLLNQVLELEAMRRDGTLFPAEVFITAIGGPERPAYAGFVRDMSERRQARDAQERLLREVQRSSSRLASLIGNLHVAVLVEDEDRRIVLANSAFCELFAIPAAPDDLIGADCSQAAEQARPLVADPDRFVREIDTALVERKLRLQDEVRLVDGREFTRDFVPIETDGRSQGHLWLYRDVTAERQAERAVAAARDDALRAASAKSEFLASMSHEIRTPMNGILATAELLAAGERLDGDERRLVAIIVESARALGRILDDVLDFSKAEAGALTPRPLVFDPAEVILAAADLFSAAGRAKDITVRAEAAGGLPRRAVGEEGWLRQIVLNLVGNAVKFTDAGEVVIRAAGRPGDAPETVLLTVEVEDTGCGIDDEDRRRLFAPFAQADSSPRRRHGGTGLGLAITKQLCDEMGGTIAVASTPGVGSVFTVVLPLTLADGVEAVDVVFAPSPRRDLRGARVLVVEDNEFNREIALRQLAVLGADATAVESGAEAVAAVAGGRFDCVLMDYHLPGMDGLETTQRIRELESEGRDTPILALTASALESDRQACLAAGMNDHLAKPLRLADLRHALERWIPAGAAEAPPTTVPAAMRDAMERLRGEVGTGTDGADGIVEIFLELLGGRLEAMRAAAERGDGQELESLGHTMTSVAATLGAERLSELCAALEQAARSGGGVGHEDAVAAIMAEGTAVRVALGTTWGLPDQG